MFVRAAGPIRARQLDMAALARTELHHLLAVLFFVSFSRSLFFSSMCICKLQISPACPPPPVQAPHFPGPAALQHAVR